VHDDPEMSMKTKPVIGKPRKIAPRGRISGIANKQLTGCVGAGTAREKKILNMKVDPEMLMKTQDRGQNVPTKFASFRPFSRPRPARLPGRPRAAYVVLS
jgi:hypothetical protein